MWLAATVLESTSLAYGQISTVGKEFCYWWCFCGLWWGMGGYTEKHRVLALLFILYTV